MRFMGLEAIYKRPRTSQPHPAHIVYPYLLRGTKGDKGRYRCFRRFLRRAGTQSSNCLTTTSSVAGHAASWISVKACDATARFLNIEDLLRQFCRIILPHNKKMTVIQPGSHQSGRSGTHQMLKVLGGDFRAGPIGITKTFFTGSLKRINIGWKSYGSERIVSVEIVTQANQTSVLGAAGGVALGGLALGGVGAIVGGVLGGNRNVMTVMVIFDDDKRALIQGSNKKVSLLLGAGANPKIEQTPSAGSGSTRRFGLKTVLWIVAIVAVPLWLNAGPKQTGDQVQTASPTVTDSKPVTEVSVLTPADGTSSFVDIGGRPTVTVTNEPVAVAKPTPVQKVAATSGLASGGALNTSDTPLGRWCWRDIPEDPEYNIIVTLKRNDAGEVEEYMFTQGRRVSGPVVVDEAMRLVRSGQLHILDNLGLLATASRLADVPTSGECSH